MLTVPGWVWSVSAFNSTRPVSSNQVLNTVCSFQPTLSAFFLNGFHWEGLFFSLPRSLWLYDCKIQIQQNLHVIIFIFRVRNTTRILVILFLPFFQRQSIFHPSDINECRVRRGGCVNASCRNRRGSFYCSCYRNYRKSRTNPLVCEGEDCSNFHKWAFLHYVIRISLSLHFSKTFALIIAKSGHKVGCLPWISTFYCKNKVYKNIRLWI